MVDSTPPLELCLEQAITSLVENYQELNSSVVAELSDLPSPIEFMRFVAKNRPFVVRGGAADWTATKEWNAEYLRKMMGERRVNVAITPYGNADSVVYQDGSDHDAMFVKPLEEQEPFGTFLSHIQAQELGASSSAAEDSLVRYAQTQNDNLPSEYAPLSTSVPASIPFASIALQQACPDATNLWIGNSKSTTALHRDSYENIYCQILGSKRFVLLPPVELPCIGDRSLPTGTYVRSSDESGLCVKRDEPRERVPFPTWDPDVPEVRETRFSGLSRPLRVELRTGDMLYLPSLWYHKVSQSCSEEGICCAVNYWYDMEFAGPFHSSCGFIRDVSLLLDAWRTQEKERVLTIRRLVQHE